MKYMLVLVMLVLCSVAYAADISVEGFKVYHGEKVDTLDWQDDDTVTISQGDNLQLQFKVINNLDNNVSIDVKATSILSLIDDIQKTKTVNLEYDQSKSFVLDYGILNFNQIGGYDLYIEFKWTINGTDYKIKKYMNLEINKVSTFVNSDTVITNLTTELVLARQQQQALLAQINTCINASNELADCRGKSATCLTYDIIHNDTMVKYNSIQSNYSIVQTNLATCQANLGGKITETECANRISLAETVAKKSASDSNYSTIALVALIGAGIFLYMKRKKDPSKNDPNIPIDWQE